MQIYIHTYIHLCIYKNGSWSKHSCQCVTRNDFAPALALHYALQGLHRVSLHWLKYLLKNWLPQKVAQGGVRWSSTLCIADLFNLRKQNLMRSSKSQKLKILRSSAGSAAISLIAEVSFSFAHLSAAAQLFRSLLCFSVLYGAACQIGFHVPHGSVCPAYQLWAVTAADAHWWLWWRE